MCAAPAKTTSAEIVAAARDIVERDGIAALSMQTVAEAVGVKAPSLYKRFAHRDGLLDAVVRDALVELRGRMVSAGGDATATAALLAMGRAYRAFAKRYPGLYALMFAARAEGGDLLQLRGEAVAPVMAALDKVVAREERLHAARLLTAFLHGFVSMELAGAFRLGGDVQQAFDYGLNGLVATVARGAAPTTRRRPRA